MTTDATERLARILLREHEQSQFRAHEDEAHKRRLTATIGLRAANMPGVVAYREALSRPGTPQVPEGPMALASARELVDLLRVRTQVDATATADGLVPQSTQVIRVQPQPSGLLDLIDFIPSASLLTRSTFVSTYTGSAGGSDEGTTAPALSGLQVSTAPLNLKPYACTADVTRDHLTDRGAFARVVEQVIRRGWAQALASDIVTGDGSDDLTTWHPTGITHIGATTIPATGAVAGVSAAVLAVQDNGYGLTSGLALVASPTTLLRIFTEEDGSGQPVRPRDLFPSITTYLPDPSVPVGTAVVGAFTEAAVVHLHTDGMSLTMAPASGSNFLSGVVTLRAEANLAVDLAAAGFAVVTGL